jgi:hypothetical protein
MILDRFKKNLKVVDNKIISYTTHVATIDHYDRIVYIHGYWSVTTAKHINYVARQLNYNTEKNEHRATN